MSTSTAKENSLSDLEALCKRLQDSSGSPPWLGEILATLPAQPSDVVPHHKPRHPHLTAKIADRMLHPALEACLHLANGDLYSCHFLVRKSQGGAKYMDWLHAMLHKLEGDFRNAKMWYVDMGRCGSCLDFARFWTVSPPSSPSPSPSTRGGGDTDQPQPQPQPRHPKKKVDGEEEEEEEEEEKVEKGGVGEGSAVVSLTALQHTDMMAWASSRGPFDVATYHHTTTACESKIASTGAAFTRSDLARLDDDRASNAARAAIVMRLELAWLVWRLQERFGWQAWDSDASTAAFREQGRIEGWEKGKDAEEVRQTKARQMVFSGAAGQRRF